MQRHFKFLALSLATAALTAGCATKPKPSQSIEHIMEAGFKGKESLSAKVSKGEASAAELRDDFVASGRVSFEFRSFAIHPQDVPLTVTAVSAASVPVEEAPPAPSPVAAPAAVAGVYGPAAPPAAPNPGTAAK